MAEENQLAVFEGNTPPTPIHSPQSTMNAPPPLTTAGTPLAHHGAPSAHLPQPFSTSMSPPPGYAPPPPMYMPSLTTQAPPPAHDPTRMATLEGNVTTIQNTVDPMAANMAEMMALFRGPNRASSISTPPLARGPTVDPAPWVPPTHTSEGDIEAAPAPTIIPVPAPHSTRAPAIHPVDFCHPQSTIPATVSLPPMTIPVSDPVMFAPPPVSVPAPATIYTTPPPMGFPASSAPVPVHTTESFPCQAPQPHISLPYQAPPPINVTFSEPGTSTQAAPRAPPTNFFPETETEQERRVKKMEETIRALQASDPRHSTSYIDSTLFPRMQLPTKVKGAYYSHLMGHKSTFSEMIMAGKQVDLGIKLGRLEGLTKKGEGELSRKTAVAAAPTNSRRGKEASVNAINLGHPGSQQYSVNFTPTPSATPAYAPPIVHYQPQHPVQPVYYRVPPAPQQIVHHYPPTLTQQYRPQASRVPQSAQQIPAAPPNVQANPLPDHRSSSGPTINMISVCTMREDESQQEGPAPFVIEYVPAEATVRFTGSSVGPAPFIIEVPAREPYQDSKVPWTYEGSVGNLEQLFSVMGVTRSGRVYENPETTGKGKAPVTSGAALAVPPISQKKMTEEEAEAFMKVIKASEYKVVEQMGKSPAHISLLALLLSSEPHREALLRVLTAAQVPKETTPNWIEEIVSSIFSNANSFSDDELPSEGWAHSRALHIVCKCNNFIIGRVMIDNGSALNVCPVSTLKQMNVDLNRVRPSKTAVRAFDGSRREVNGEIDLLIDVGPCSFSVTFQVLDIPNAFSLLLGRPWIHSTGAVPSSMHQRIKFIAEGRLITVKGEEDYTIYKEMAIPYISIGNDENLPFHSFETISVIRDYGEVRPSRADRMIGKVLLHHNYVPSTGLGAQGQGINCPIEIEEYKNRRGLGFRPSCHKIIEARKGKHLRRLAAYYEKVNWGILVLPLSHFFSSTVAHRRRYS
ncbi:hypothetical protein CRG98_036829 [Punica granatum]|uniref:G-patch domain-containing protein n=1 Tax=Punica granatum TaxID=22663 RepID=A0A2I0IG72_PUNGR|nr:hypothetical protein CRG98_036829 [Punica granatum]